jgi:hypothetical protein
MEIIHVLIDTPVVAFLLLLGLLVTVVLLVAGLFSRRKARKSDAAVLPAPEPGTSRFLGTQMDLGILLFGLVLLLGVIGWLKKVFFG